MPRRLDPGRLDEDIKRYLRQTGPSSTTDIIKRLNISQPVFSRLAGRLGPDLLTTGKARSTRYTLKREIQDVGFAVPIYEINEHGESVQFATLHAIWPKGFYLKAKVRDIKVRDIKDDFFDDLPYFLDDLRPSGFLGRLIPKRHPELNVPDDVRLWSSDHCLKYLARFGTDSIGNFIVGDGSFELYLAQAKNPTDVVSIDKRPSAYAKMADDVLRFGPAGSSAGGEQPKFLAIRGPERTPVIVKFSPPVLDPISERVADLIVCEHIAHEVLLKHGLASAKSALISYDERFFLEIERFDRIGASGRKGLISLGALCSQFTGIFNSWSKAAEELTRQKIIDSDTHASIRTIEMFGHLIANTDMHMANLSFFTRGTLISGLSPAYDMLPMMYAPRHSQLITLPFEPPLSQPMDSDIWGRAWSTARDFWNQAASSDEISTGFRSIARTNVEKLSSLDYVKNLLP